MTAKQEDARDLAHRAAEALNSNKWAAYFISCVLGLTLPLGNLIGLTLTHILPLVPHDMYIRARKAAVVARPLTKRILPLWYVNTVIVITKGRTTSIHLYKSGNFSSSFLK